MTLRSNDPAIQYLLDRAQLNDVIVRYILQLESSSYGGGLEAIDEARKFLTEDMSVEYVGGTLYEGADAWIEGFKESVPAIGKTFHTLSNFVYTVDGDNAEVKFYISARHMWPEGDVMLGGAQYTSRLERQSSGWLIASMFLDIKWMHDPAGRLPPPGPVPASAGATQQ